MAFPEDIGVIDTMMGTTAGTTGTNRYAFLDRALKDAESANMNFPAQYMFKDVPFSDQARDADGTLEEPPQGPDLLLPFMDRCNVEIAMDALRVPDGDAAASDKRESARSETRERVNFEVSEIQREVLRTPGAIDRITTAVLVDGMFVPGEDGEPVWQPRPAEEMAALFKQRVADAEAAAAALALAEAQAAAELGDNDSA